MKVKKSSNPIGVFDSGLGGLTVVREIKRLLPKEDIIYLGDSARLPYGIKSKRQIIQFSLENARFLLGKKVKALVIACNSSSANAFGALRQELKIPVIDVILPVSREACELTRNGKVGVIGTLATIESLSYERAIKKIDRKIKIYSQECPLFVPLIEEGWLKDSITRSVIKRYLLPIKEKKVDTLILGCTHYPLLKKFIASEMGCTVNVIDSAPSAACLLKKRLLSENMLNNKSRKGKLSIFVTDLSPNFVKIGERFLKHKLGGVKVVKV